MTKNIIFFIIAPLQTVKCTDFLFDISTNRRILRRDKRTRIEAARRFTMDPADSLLVSGVICKYLFQKSAVQIDVTVTAWVFVKIILMVFLRLPKIFQRKDFRTDRLIVL